MTAPSAHDVAELLSSQAETVLRYLLPAGEIIGHEFCVGSLQGEAGKSLKVSLSPGKLGVWQDFASPADSGGDLLDLWAAVRCNRTLSRALREARDWLGDAPTANGGRQQSGRRKAGGEWIYRDSEGEPWIKIKRFDYPDGRKVFFQEDLKAGKTIKSGGHQLPDPRPLYNLDLLQTPEQDVWFCEGEKAAEALKSLGFLSTTTIGGSSSPHKTDFSPLAGRRVYIWPDNDNAGKKYASKVIDLLQAVGAVYTLVSIPSKKPDSWDAGDAVVEGWGREQVEGLKPRGEILVASEVLPLGSYPCPPELWRGFFAEIAEVTKQQTWEVWMGAFCGLAALAHRHITVRYWGMLCGNVYGLLIKPTGTGKKICTDTCEGILPSWYMQTGTVSSGPALAPILAEIKRGKNGVVQSVSPHPAILVLQEWTSLAKYLKLQFSSLSEDLNKIFDCPQYWNVTRSDRDKAGGHLSIPLPTLSILGTTTDQLFKKHISEEMVFSGFLNRYLILPGSHDKWRLYDKETAAVDYGRLEDIISMLPMADATITHPFGALPPIDECYTPEAWDWYTAWGTEFFEEGLMNGTGQNVPMAERLHVYAHKIALLYAWSENKSLVEVEHVEIARLVIETSTNYLRELAEKTEVEAPPYKKYEADLAVKIMDLVRKKPGQLTVKRLYQNHLRKSATYQEIKKSVDGLLQSEEMMVIDGKFVQKND